MRIPLLTGLLGLVHSRRAVRTLRAAWPGTGWCLCRARTRAPARTVCMSTSTTSGASLVTLFAALICRLLCVFVYVCCLHLCVVCMGADGMDWSEAPSMRAVLSTPVCTICAHVRCGQ